MVIISVPLFLVLTVNSSVGSCQDQYRDDDVRAAKNKKIAASARKTRERRKRQTPRVIDLKIVTNKLSPTQRESLERLFVEAKWVYNGIIGSEDAFTYQAPKKTVAVHTPKGIEQRELKVLSAQMKQSIVAGVRSSIKIHIH